MKFTPLMITLVWAQTADHVYDNIQIESIISKHKDSTYERASIDPVYESQSNQYKSGRSAQRDSTSENSDTIQPLLTKTEVFDKSTALLRFTRAAGYAADDVIYKVSGFSFSTRLQCPRVQSFLASPHITLLRHAANGARTSCAGPAFQAYVYIRDKLNERGDRITKKLAVFDPELLKSIPGAADDKLLTYLAIGAWFYFMISVIEHFICVLFINPVHNLLKKTDKTCTRPRSGGSQSHEGSPIEVGVQVNARMDKNSSKPIRSAVIA